MRCVFYAKMAIFSCVSAFIHQLLSTHFHLCDVSSRLPKADHQSLIQYRLHHEVEVFMRFTLPRAADQGSVISVETEPSDVINLYHAWSDPGFCKGGG